MINLKDARQVIAAAEAKAHELRPSAQPQARPSRLLCAKPVTVLQGKEAR